MSIVKSIVTAAAMSVIAISASASSNTVYAIESADVVPAEMTFTASAIETDVVLYDIEINGMEFADCTMEEDATGNTRYFYEDTTILVDDDVVVIFGQNGDDPDVYDISELIVK